MFVTIINDCRDPNAMNRQATRAAQYFGTAVTTLGVHNDLEAAGNIIDTLDAAEGAPGVILANVAPRNGKAKKWANGTPFGYFYVGKTLVVSTIDGQCLSLVKKFGLAKEVHVFDIPTVIDEAIRDGRLTEMHRDLIVNSQFRSYQFVPRVAKWVADGIKVPTETLPISEVQDAPHGIWWVDNFGNCKTTMLAEEIGHTAGKTLKTRFGEIPCYNRLKDVPNDEPGLIVGSSGLNDTRFVELVVQGKSAAARFEIQSGMSLMNE